MRAPQHKRPIWLGALTGSLAPPACLLAILYSTRTGNPSLADVARAGAATFSVALLVSASAMLALGLPLVLWLRSKRILTSLFVCAGAVAAGTVTFAFLAWSVTRDHRLPEPLQLLYGAGFGLAAGVAFCVGAGLTDHFIRRPVEGRPGPGAGDVP